MGILTNGPKIGETITDDECELLQGLLKFRRHHPRWIGGFLKYLAWHGSHCNSDRDRMDLGDMSFHLIECYNQGTL
jgi:hypothetical protein